MNEQRVVLANGSRLLREMLKRIIHKSQNLELIREITDVKDLLDGTNRKAYAVAWLGSLPDRETIAERVSPLTYVREGLPPTLIIQGDADPTVPYAQSLRLRDALTKAKVPNELVTVPGGKHGQFSAPERTMIYVKIREFLAKHKLGPNL